LTPSRLKFDWALDSNCRVLLYESQKKLIQSQLMRESERKRNMICDVIKCECVHSNVRTSESLKMISSFDDKYCE
jgi:hypothetical protein